MPVAPSAISRVPASADRIGSAAQSQRICNWPFRSYAISETEGGRSAAKARVQSFLNTNRPAAMPSTIAAHQSHLRELFGGGGATGPLSGGADSFRRGAGSGGGGLGASRTGCNRNSL